MMPLKKRENHSGELLQLIYLGVSTINVRGFVVGDIN